MAEFVMKELCRRAGVADQFEIASAAVSTEETGNDIYPPAKRKLREKGIPFDRHAARQITRADYTYYDHIVCADHANLRWLNRIVGEDRDHKVSLMMSWSQPQSSHSTSPVLIDARDVSDPWYTGDFETAYQDIELSCTAMLERLLRH